MRFATDSFLNDLQLQAEAMKQKIRLSPDNIKCIGTVYYVASNGHDSNNGLDIQHPWKSLQKVSGFPLQPGDAVLFKRGDVFRGQIICHPGVTYAAWGTGNKPVICGWEKNLANPSLWECYDEEHRIYHLKDKILDCGTLVFNEGEKHSQKLIPSCIGGEFFCREDQEKPFVMTEEMKHDLDIL